MIKMRSERMAKMNLLEIYLKEIHEEKPYNSEWCRKFPEQEFVEVTATWDCYGKVYKQTNVYNTKIWREIKESGYYMG